MKNKYYDLIDQTFDFPQDEFRTEEGELYFHDIPLMEIIKHVQLLLLHQEFALFLCPRRGLEE